MSVQDNAMLARTAHESFNGRDFDRVAAGELVMDQRRDGGDLPRPGGREFCQIRNGKIVGASAYFDLATMIGQHGLMLSPERAGA